MQEKVISVRTYNWHKKKFYYFKINKNNKILEQKQIQGTIVLTFKHLNHDQFNVHHNPLSSVGGRGK